MYKKNRNCNYKMTLCIFAKILGALIGIGIAYFYPSQLTLQGATLGLAPIWLEVIACHLAKVEPGRETRNFWLSLDAVTDIVVFLLLPALWFNLAFLPSWWVIAATFGFVGAGLCRIYRFLKTGLVRGAFEGLPVTYTGYFWGVGAFLRRAQLTDLSVIVMVFLSVSMIHRGIRIRPSQ
jgi:hypothetical protein